MMSCVSFASFAVLINGETIPFFQSERGLIQDYPLSPLLFILVMEGLRLLLKQAQSERNLSRVKVSRLIKILNLFFVDDVLIMANASVQEWKEIDSILSTFFHALVLIVNQHKSTLHFSGVQQEDLVPYKAIFPYKIVDLSASFRYLIFYLKPTNYKVEYWR